MNGIHHAVAAGFAFGVGVSVGSFLNVCVWRLPRGESLIHPPSRCTRCDTPIPARDNLPVLGWLLLGGRCRSCSQPVSSRYPLVEAAVGFLFAAVLLFETTSSPLDPFDRGPVHVLARVAYHWALVSLLVTAALISHDRVASPFGPPLASPFTARNLAAALLTFTACLTGDPVSSVLNLSLLAVFLQGV